MKTNEYLRLLKNELDIALSIYPHRIKLKEYNSIIIVDITVNFRQPNFFMYSRFTHHDVISMPKEFTYGIAKVQSTLIINSMFGIMSTFFLS